MNPVRQEPLVCRSLHNAKEVIARLELQLDDIVKEREAVFARLQAFCDSLEDADAARYTPGEWAKLIGQCEQILKLSLRLIRRTAKEKAHAQNLIDAAQAAAAQQNKELYTVILMQSLLYNKASAHGTIHFDLLQPHFQKIVLNALEDVTPPLFARESYLSREVEFYQNLFTAMLSPAAQKWPPQRDYLMENLVPKFSSLPYLRTRAPLRLLRNVHNKAVSRYLKNDGEDNYVFSPHTAGKKFRIGFFAAGNSHGHGWPCIKRVIERLDRNIVEPVLLTYFDDPSLPDTEIERFVVVDWETAIADIRTLRLDMLFFSTPFDRELSTKFMILGHYRLAPLQVTAFFNNTTTALPSMDVIITSPSMDDPAALDRLFAEKEVILMRNLPFAFDAEGYFPETCEKITRADLGLPDGAKIITCGNSLWVKANMEFFEFIASLLKHDRNFYFVLMPVPAPSSEDVLFLRLCEVFDAAGIDRRRVIIVEPPSRIRHYGILALADLYIDFFPFSGANSLFDALWTRTPLLTRASEYLMRYRQGRAILEDIGLGEMVARDEADMKQKALHILSGGGEALRQKMGPKKVLSCSAFDGRSAIELANILTNLARRTASRINQKENVAA